jgi:SAM-dependent methyltransferase
MRTGDCSPPEPGKISAEVVRADFNDLPAVLYYTRAAHELGLWASERALVERYFPDPQAHLFEAGCGAGRVTLGLWQLGYRRLTAFDFAGELLDQARSLARLKHAEAITFLLADAGDLRSCRRLDDHAAAAGQLDGREVALADAQFDGALFMFNGLMQIPGRSNRRKALGELHRVCRLHAPLLFTTHDRDSSPEERERWRLEARRWARGEQDPRLVEFGDRYFHHEAGRTFMHLPDRSEVLADLAATGWQHDFDAPRIEIAREHHAVSEFSDECRFWAAKRLA